MHNPLSRALLPVLLLLPAALGAAGADIKCTIAPLHSGEVIFGHYFGTEKRLLPDDTLTLDAQGTVFVKTAEPLAQGMYFFYLPGRAKLDVLIGADQQFTVRTDTSAMAAHAVFSGSSDNETFQKYNEFNRQKYAEYTALSGKFNQAGTEAEKALLRQQITALSRAKNNYIDSLAAIHKGSLVSKLLLATMEPDIPDAPAGAPAGWQARWFSQHFFDHFDLTDSVMLRTPFYENRLLTYFNQHVPAHADSITAAADRILARVKFSPELFRFNIITLWNTYVSSKQMGMDAVWVHLAEKWYLPYGTWLTAVDRKLIEDEVNRKKYNLIGLPAPPLEQLMALPADHFKLAAVDTTTRYDLHAGTMLADFRKSIQSRYTVLFFWDVTCSHCREFILKLHEVHPALQKLGCSVVTVQILISREGKSKWVDYINENKLYEWTNTWSPYSAEYRKLYDTELVPILYVLDEHKTIIAKQLQPEQLEDFLQFHINQNK